MFGWLLLKNTWNQCVDRQIEHWLFTLCRFDSVFRFSVASGYLLWRIWTMDGTKKVASPLVDSHFTASGLILHPRIHLARAFWPTNQKRTLAGFTAGVSEALTVSNIAKRKWKTDTSCLKVNQRCSDCFIVSVLLALICMEDARLATRAHETVASQPLPVMWTSNQSGHQVASDTGLNMPFVVI